MIGEPSDRRGTSRAIDTGGGAGAVLRRGCPPHRRDRFRVLGAIADRLASGLLRPGALGLIVGLMYAHARRWNLSPPGLDPPRPTQCSTGGAAFAPLGGRLSEYEQAIFPGLPGTLELDMHRGEHLRRRPRTSADAHLCPFGIRGHPRLRAVRNGCQSTVGVPERAKGVRITAVLRASRNFLPPSSRWGHHGQPGPLRGQLSCLGAAGRCREGSPAKHLRS